MNAAEWRSKKKTVEVLGKTMSYVEMGEGDPILLLHGNPTSSFLWRDVVPPLEGLGRCILPDLIGMGDSDKLEDSGPDRYTFVEHRQYLDAFYDAVDLGDRVSFVIHDWGSALGFDWAARHPERVKGIAYMEAIVMPVTWDDWPEAARNIFQGMRSEAGEEMILDKNLFVELVLPGSIQRRLSPDEMDEYRRPFLEAGEVRRPTLTWPRQIPLDGKPEDVVEISRSYGEWLSTSEIPKLFINADPGAILIGRQRDFCRSWPNQTEVTVNGIHFIQEDSGAEIGAAIAEWLRGIP
jgi:haloalkane dehalogenase